MLDRHMIEKRINHIKEHGDCAQDVRDLAMLLYVKDHMDEEEDEYHHEEKHHKLTQEMAERWVEGMVSDDPAARYGGKWTMEQVKPVAQKYGVPTEGERFAEFWAVMNALYSDYYLVAKKYNVLNPDFFADMAMAFINDQDAVRNKSAVYYECIVEK